MNNREPQEPSAHGALRTGAGAGQYAPAPAGKGASRRNLLARVLSTVAALLLLSAIILGIAPAQATAQSAAVLSMPDAQVDLGEHLTVALAYTHGGAANPTSIDLAITWDASILSLVSYAPGGLTANEWFSAVNATIPGTLVLSSATSGAGLAANGDVLVLTFKEVGSGHSPLTFLRAQLKNRTIPSALPLTLVAGGVTVRTEPVVDPGVPTFHPITRCGESGSVDVPPNGTGYSFTQVGNGSTGIHTVTAHAAPGYHFAGNVTVLTWTQDLGAFTTCATPIAPSFTPINACGTYGKIALVAAPGVIYLHKETAYTDSGEIPGILQGTHTVTAIAASGYSFPPTTQSFWSGDLGAYLTCATPVAPTVIPISACNAYGQVIFANTPGVVYRQDPPAAVEGQIEVSAAPANASYGLSGYTGPWLYDLGAYSPCPPSGIEIVPNAPTATPISACNQSGEVHPGTQQGVVYAISPAGAHEGMVTVTATPSAGYFFPASAIRQWTFNLGMRTTCASPGAPTFQPIVACGTDGAVTWPTVVGVVYAMTEGNGLAGPVTVAATPLPGYAFPPASQSLWSSNLGTHTTCVTPPAPVHEDAGIGIEGQLLLPVMSGIVWQISDANAIEGLVTVTATLQSGFEFPLGTVHVWVVDLGDYLSPVTPVPPTVTPISACGMYGSVALSATTGVEYTLSPANAVEGEVVVSARAQADYGLVGYTGPWEYDLGAYYACAAEAPITYLTFILYEVGGD